MSITKTRMDLIDLNFVSVMADCLHEGLRGDRSPFDWQNLEPDFARSRHMAKILRHLRDYGNADNAVDRCKHAAAIACNAMILWYHK